MMRNAVPPGGGWVPMSTAPRSVGPVMSAGAPFVAHSRFMTFLRAGRTEQFGFGPSNSTTALPDASTVVTTRRTLPSSDMRLPLLGSGFG